MMNCGLTDLRLVRPRDGWPNPAATAMAANAESILENARVFDSVADATADLTHLYATTARERDSSKARFNRALSGLRLLQKQVRGPGGCLVRQGSHRPGK